MERKTAWKKYDDRYKEQISDFCEGYKAFITECKTAQKKASVSQACLKA